ncbi:uncharacterized protein JCM6883_001367 [Sporobolomyces salmoneus]|uniref:uncharacterized protein n=1 Tax=Sporobolomyces salmoneus TaxID=183962 RepID=UPI00316E6706
MSRSNTTAAQLAQTNVNNKQGDSAPIDPTPLDFDSEADLLALLDRMREELGQRVTAAMEKAQNNSKGKAKESLDRAKIDEIVQKKFFDHVMQTVLKNCTIAGEPYKIDKKTRKVVLKGDAVETQPLDQKLDANVRKYQEQLFDAREVNAKERIDAPQRVAEDVKRMVSLDRESLDKLEGIRFVLPETEQSLRPDTKEKETDGITPAQAQEYFATAKDGLKQTLRDVPHLDNATTQATSTAIDTSRLS